MLLTTLLKQKPGAEFEQDYQCRRCYRPVLGKASVCQFCGGKAMASPPLPTRPAAPGGFAPLAAEANATPPLAPHAEAMPVASGWQQAPRRAPAPKDSQRAALLNDAGSPLLPRFLKTAAMRRLVRTAALQGPQPPNTRPRQDDVLANIAAVCAPSPDPSSPVASSSNKASLPARPGRRSPSLRLQQEGAVVRRSQPMPAPALPADAEGSQRAGRILSQFNLLLQLLTLACLVYGFFSLGAGRLFEALILMAVGTLCLRETMLGRQAEK